MENNLFMVLEECPLKHPSHFGGSCGFVKTIVSPVLNAGNGDFISALHVAKIPPDTKMIPIALKLSVGTSIPACFAPHNPTALTTDPAPEEMNPQASP
jgi:hypothetical protein